MGRSVGTRYGLKTFTCYQIWRFYQVTPGQVRPLTTFRLLFSQLLVVVCLTPQPDCALWRYGRFLGPHEGRSTMASGTDEFDAILKFDARRLAAMAMSAYGESAHLRRALCMQHCSHPPFPSHCSHACTAGMARCRCADSQARHHPGTSAGVPHPTCAT